MMPAIVIARGGSKRIPGKNVKDFCGKPLVEWSIIQAKECEGADLVVLSTDSDQIAEIGQRHNVKVLMRPEMPDNTTGAVAFNLAIDRLYAEGYEFDACMTLLATGPLRLPNDLDNALTLYYAYAKELRTQVVSILLTGPSIHIPTKKHEIGFKQLYEGANETVGIDIGLFSICDVWSYKQVTQKIHDDDKHLVQIRRKVHKIHPVVIPAYCKSWQATDIDVQEEFELAEILFKHYILNKGHYQ